MLQSFRLYDLFVLSFVQLVVTTVLAYIGLLTPLWTLAVVGAIIFFVSRERS